MVFIEDSNGPRLRIRPLPAPCLSRKYVNKFFIHQKNEGSLLRYLLVNHVNWTAKIEVNKIDFGVLFEQLGTFTKNIGISATDLIKQ